MGMRLAPTSVLSLSLALAVVPACGSSSGGTPSGSADAALDSSAPGLDAGGTGKDAASDVSSAADVQSDAAVAPTDATAGVDAADAGGGGAVDAGLDGPAGVAHDPSVPGPYTYKELDDTMNVAASGDTNVAIHCAYPTAGPSSGPYPVVIIAHGFDLPATQYYGYAQRLASFGYVALTVNYPTSFTVNNPSNAQDLVAGIDWAKANATVGSISDTNQVGMTGHSLGGKLALLAATMDSRVKASIVLDPVDGGMGACTPPSCVTVADLMPSLHIPTGFLGEITDSADSGTSCAPGPDNYTTFYAKTNSPSLEVTVVGADHMAFLDDVASCFIVCSVCVAGTASNAQVSGIGHAYVAAFYERWLRGNTAYDTYLTGPQAQSRYVSMNEITILSK